MLESGTFLHDRYTILGLLAQGGTSTVYRARDSHLPGVWAVKEMADLTPDPEDRKTILEQFRREAHLLLTLFHPGLPRVIDCFSEGESHYIVEELFEGMTLDDRAAGRQMSEEEAAEGARQILSILDFLHGNSIIYRDLKPQNIVVCPDGAWKLIDFGIARLFTAGKRRDTVLMGTPGFAAPEHYGSRQTDARSDIYGLGAVLHFLVTGVDPGLSPFDFDDPQKSNPALSRRFSDIILTAVERDPDDRFQTAREMLATLDNPQECAIRAVQYRYPERLPFITRGNLPVILPGAFLTLMSTFTLFVFGFPHPAGIFGVPMLAGGLITRYREITARRNQALEATARELIVSRKGELERIPWSAIRKVEIRRFRDTDNRKSWFYKAVVDEEKHDLTVTDSTLFAGKVTLHYVDSDGIQREFQIGTDLPGWRELVNTLIFRAGLVPLAGDMGSSTEVYVNDARR